MQVCYYRYTAVSPCFLYFKSTTGEDVNYAEYKDPHLVANLLKIYLRELPDPLLTYALYPRFVEAASMFLYPYSSAFPCLYFSVFLLIVHS